jgi:hypothetical protein
MEKFAVTINGVPDPMLLGDIVEITVDTNVYQPSMFTIVIQDTREPTTGLLKYTDNQLTFRIGAPVTISVIADSLATFLIPQPNMIMIGEITSIEPIFDKDGSVKLRLRGFDKGHRLTYGKKTRVFGTGTTPVEVNESMVISSICSQAGLAPLIMDPSLMTVMSGYVMQYNQSDWDFLMSRLRLFGDQMYVMGPSLVITKAGMERLPPVTGPLEFGKDLLKFEPRIDSLGLVNMVEAHGWDPLTKMPIVGMAPAATSIPSVIIGDLIPGSAVLTTGFGMTSAKDIIMDPRLCNIGQATRAAMARMDTHATSHVRATGETALYNPYILAGRSITVTGMGIRFSGKYYVTQARHTFRGGMWKVFFEVSGTNPYTFRDILNGDGHSDSASSQKFDGAVIGVVTDVLDPTQNGRVKVKFPWMPKSSMGMDIASSYARVASIGAGPSRGIMFLPEVNDEVLVIFENGDLSKPIIIGGLWNTKDRVPMAGGPATMGPLVVKRIIRSRSGHMIVLDDTAGNEQILIQDKLGLNKITIKSVDNSISIESTGEMKLTTKANLTLDALGQVKITGKAGVAMESQAMTSIKGMTTSVEGTGNVTVKDGAGGQIAINGPIVNVNNGALEVM